MTVPKFLRAKTTYIILAILVGGYVWYANASAASKQPVYETAAVERGDLFQTVEVTGEIKPSARIDLSFRNSGTINSINVKVGDQVKQGMVLAQLDNSDTAYAVQNAKAALDIADANLEARLAGETIQSIHVAETQVAQAQAAYDKANVDLAAAKTTAADTLKNAQLAVSTAQHNLDNSQASVDQALTNSYDTAHTTLLTALGPLQTGLSDGDQITGVDNTAAAQYLLPALGMLDSGSLDRAKNSYIVAKAAKLGAESAAKSLTANSSPQDILAAADKIQTAVALVQTYLTDVQKVLAASITSTYLTSTDLATKRATIDADRTSISAQNTNVLAATQAIKNSDLTRQNTTQQLQDAYSTAANNYDVAKTSTTNSVQTAETNVKIQKAALDAAQATLDLKKAGPRAVDVAGLRAAVEQAQAAYDKAVADQQNIQVIAPLDGTVTEIIPEIGENATPNAVAIRMLAANQLDIEALVPEADITKIQVGQVIDTTLDAYGDEVHFAGTITAKDPDQTKVQDAVYYKIHSQIDPSGKDVKPGMTANVTVHTGESKNALIIPLRAVRTDSATLQKSVRILVNGQPQNRAVTLGLRGDEGRVEVTSGLNEKDNVIVSESVGGIAK